MEAMDDIVLLREYAARNSEAAFETLVSRRISFVYSAALRQVRDPHLAEEVTQAVFIILARKAGRISEKTILIGWLFKTTRFAALAQTRAAAKRRQREQEAQMHIEVESPVPDPLWEQIAPMLDQALASLGETDRRAILLRFFENKGLAEVGCALKTSEDTARKRVNRALEKLRKYFSSRGVVSSSATIAAGISANSVQAAPVALAKSVSAIAFGKGATATISGLTLVKGTLKMMNWIKYKTLVGVSAGILLTTTVALTVAKDTTKEEPGGIVPRPVLVAPRAVAADLPPMTASTSEEFTPSNILARVALAYADLSTYRDTGWTVHQYKGDSWTNTFTELLGTRTCYRVEIVTARHPFSSTNRYFSDGLESYMQSGTPTVFTMGALDGNISSTYNETCVPVLYFNLSWGDIFVPFRLGPSSELLRRPDEKVGDVDCYVVTRTTTANPATLWVGKQDFLIRRCQYLGRIETHENISTNETLTRADYIPAGIKPKHQWE